MGRFPKAIVLPLDAGSTDLYCAAISGGVWARPVTHVRFEDRIDALAPAWIRRHRLRAVGRHP